MLGRPIYNAIERRILEHPCIAVVASIDPAARVREGNQSWQAPAAQLRLTLRCLLASPSQGSIRTSYEFRIEELPINTFSEGVVVSMLDPGEALPR